MKKLLTALCTVALAAAMGVGTGVSALAEATDTVTGPNTIIITPIDLSATATFAAPFTVDPNGATLADIWGGTDAVITNTSGAPVFYVYSAVDYVGIAADIGGYYTTLLGDFTYIPIGTRTDLAWTNLGTAATYTDFWVGTDVVGVKTDILALYAGETAANVLASKYDIPANSANVDAVTIRTGTSWAEALTLDIGVVVTIALTVGGYPGV